jgi:pyruvate dehydrogenase E2 component (dihydrolipoamide acetyltransferase)
MATVVLLPKQGNSVESCIIKSWLKKAGDTVAEGDGLCEVETDKATVEVPAPAAGTLLAIFRKVGEDVPVQTAIAAIGKAGEDVAGLAPGGAAAPAPAAAPAAPAAPAAAVAAPAPAPMAAPVAVAASSAGSSPRARAAAEAKGVDVAGLAGSGPGGLVIERDVKAAQVGGTGLGGRVTAADKAAPALAPAPSTQHPAPGGGGAATTIPVKGIRKIIADRMRQSLSSSAQLTLNATAKAATLQAWRAKAKDKAEALGLPAVTVNDLILFAVARTLPRFPGLNAHWQGDKIVQYGAVHLGMAVDTERGLMVPVLKDAHAKTLAQIATDAKALAKAAQAGKATPDQLSGSTFSVTNVGALGIEYFTPVLNTPEVAILGVGAITLRPYQGASGVEFIPSLHLSLTIDHQALDGAPAARFMQALVAAIENIDVLLAA